MVRDTPAASATSRMVGLDPCRTDDSRVLLRRLVAAPENFVLGVNPIWNSSPKHRSPARGRLRPVQATRGHLAPIPGPRMGRM
ncbi:hypothetical protein NicSoilB8_02120 [Arthrobacter sp. NicSoilB8]|nr:hypothetical protein NicSoilB8_02120 [Arthrobacter sp. NicSoilB8]